MRTVGVLVVVGIEVAIGDSDAHRGVGTIANGGCCAFQEITVLNHVAFARLVEIDVGTRRKGTVVNGKRTILCFKFAIGGAHIKAHIFKTRVGNFG